MIINYNVFDRLLRTWHAKTFSTIMYMYNRKLLRYQSNVLNLEFRARIFTKIISQCLIKCQIFVRNLNMPKTKRYGAEEPTMNHFSKIDSRNFWICSFKCRSTGANRSISYQPKYRQKYSLATSVLGDSYGPPAETHAKWKKNLERDFQISKHHLP